MGRFKFALVSVLLTASMATPVLAFETPEAAVREYLEGLADADIERVVEATGIDEMVEGYKFELMVDRLQGYSPVSRGPSHSGLFADMERGRWTAEFLFQARTLVYSLLARERLGDGLDGRFVGDLESGWASGLLADLDESRLGDLVIVDIKRPTGEYFEETRYRELLARNASLYSADEVADLVALLLFEGETYAVGFQLIRYGDGWRVLSQNSPLLDFSSLGAAEPMTGSEFSDLTSEPGE